MTAKLCMAVFIIYLGIGIYYNINTLTKKEIIRTVILDDAIEFVELQNPTRLFNEYNFGGELIFNNIKTFVDGRADIFSKKNLAEYIAMRNLNIDPEAIIEKYDFDGYLVDKSTAIAVYLKSHEDKFELIYEDEFAQYFLNKVEE